jgi:hypothetical protein
MAEQKPRLDAYCHAGWHRMCQVDGRPCACACHAEPTFNAARVLDSDEEAEALRRFKPFGRHLAD